MAAARDIKGEKHEVIAVIGDGSLTGGEAYEGLNNIGEMKSKVIVILNDNGMSISPNTGGISKHLGNLRTSKGYLGLKIRKTSSEYRLKLRRLSGRRSCRYKKRHQIYHNGLRRRAL